MKSKETVRFNNTVLRDGHQSLAATRMTTRQMLPPAPILDGMEFAGLETWGGAVIDSCLRYLSENPFDRLRTLKKAAPLTPHIMLLRGQNIVQYTSFPDDVVEAFIRCSIEAGMDVFRIFDALNDLRNLETSIRTVVKLGKHARGEICYTLSPVHTMEAFVRMGKDLESMGCHSIGIKDMAGIMRPQVAAELVRRLKKEVKIPLVLHSHDTAGLAASSYCAAIDAGVDTIETSIAPFANGTSQPDTLRMLELLKDHPRCPRFDRGLLYELRCDFEKIHAELGAFTSPANERVDSDTLIYQVPGGMLSNFRNQLKEQGMAERLPEVLKEIPVVREALGWIPLVTPTSQIVGTQAMMNVKFGRWKMISQPVTDILLGKYGHTPGPVDSQLLRDTVKKTGESPVSGRPADSLKPGMAGLREKLAEKGLPVSDEYAVLYAMFPQELTQLLLPAKSPAFRPIVTAPLSSTPQPLPQTTAWNYRLQLNNRTMDALVEEMA